MGGGGRDGVVWRALASLQCGPGWIPSDDTIYGWSLLLVLAPATGAFLPPQKPTFLNSNSTWNVQSPLNELLESSLVLHGKTINGIHTPAH